MAVAAIEGPIPSFLLYGETPPAYDQRMLHVETIAFRSARHRWKIDPHVHPTLHQLLYVERGRGTALAECRATPYRPPALVLVPAGAVHGFEFEPGTQGFVASITDDLTREIAAREPGAGTLFERTVIIELERGAACAAELEDCFAKFAREFDGSGSGRTLALEGWLRVIVARVLRLSRVRAETTIQSAGRQRALVMRFRELVEDEFRGNRSVADYAFALNVSESQLRRACLNVTVQSPLQLIHARILLEAKRSLIHTAQSVSEIAYALGFDDPAYFTRFFSQRTKLAPSVFRARGGRA